VPIAESNGIILLTGANGTTYTYQVRFNNGCGLSATSGAAQAADGLGLSPGKQLLRDVETLAEHDFLPYQYFLVMRARQRLP